MGTSQCIDLESVRGEEKIKCELEEENKEESTLGALRYVSFSDIPDGCLCYFSFWWENVSLQKQAKGWDFDQDLFCRICTADRSRCCTEITAEIVRKAEI